MERLSLRIVTPLAACLLAVFALAACNGDDNGGMPTATLPPTGTATATSTATSTRPPGTAEAGPAIDAGNAASLAQAGEFEADNVQQLAWSMDGALLLVSDQAIDEYNEASGALERVLEVPGPQRVLALSRGGGIAAVEDSGAVRLVAVPTGSDLTTLEPGAMSRAADFYNDGEGVALVAGDRIAVTLWDTMTGQQTAELTGFETAAPVYNLVMSPDGKQAAWVSRATVQFHDVTTNTLGPRLELDDFASKAVFAPGGTRLLTLTGAQTGGQVGGLLQLWTPANGEETLRITGTAIFTDAAFTPDGNLIATGSDQGITFWSALDGNEAGALDAGGSVRQLSISPDGTTLATVSDEGGEHLVGRLWRLL